MPIESDDVLLNKAAIIERCIRRIREEYSKDPELEDYTHIDAMTLNAERACQAAIDLAMHIVATERLGMPQTSAEAFTLLANHRFITKEQETALSAMVGFRNIAVHQYQEMNLEVLRYIASRGWQDLVDFCQALGLRIESD